MIPDGTEGRARLARSRHRVPALRAKAKQNGLEVGEYLDFLGASLSPEMHVQAAPLIREIADVVEYDDFIRGRDEAKAVEAKLKEAEDVGYAHTELQEKHKELKREHAELHRAYDALFQRIHSTGRQHGERGKGRKAPS